MKDTDKPNVDVNLSEDGMTASVIITFPFLNQALAFGDVCRTLLEKMSDIAKVPKA